MKCRIIEDLLPLYLDDACSEESKGAVEEHLASCEACREKAERMRGDYVAVVRDEEKISRRLREGELVAKREKEIRKGEKLSIFGYGVLADAAAITAVLVLICVKMTEYGIAEILKQSVPFASVMLLIGLVGVVVEWIYLIGNFVMKKEMGVMRMYSGLFMVNQFAALIMLLIVGIAVAAKMPPEEFFTFMF